MTGEGAGRARYVYGNVPISLLRSQRRSYLCGGLGKREPLRDKGGAQKDTSVPLSCCSVLNSVRDRRCLTHASFIAPVSSTPRDSLVKAGSRASPPCPRLGLLYSLSP